MKNGGWANRIHRWFGLRERNQRIEEVEQESRRIVRIVERVESEEKTFLIGSLNAGDFKTCPLCGQKLGPPQDDSEHRHLLE